MIDIDFDLPDLSGHPPPPQVTLGVYEKWVFESFAQNRRQTMTKDQVIADFMKNEGRQTEEWPDFGDA
jgi:hypothetical protein